MCFTTFIYTFLGGATLELEKSLSEGAGLKGGYSTTDIQSGRQRVRVEEISLRNSVWNRSVIYKFYKLM